MEIPIENKRAFFAPFASALILMAPCGAASGAAGNQQSTLGSELAALMTLKDPIRSADTRTRVEAFHRVWTIGLISENSEVKSNALGLLRECVNSASDHIRMPAVYAVVEIAGSTPDVSVKLAALNTLGPALQAEQVPIRIMAVDAVNRIVRSGRPRDMAVEALRGLAGPVRSGNNGVRIPAISAVVNVVEHSNDDEAYSTALDMMVAPLNSAAMIGGLEVRMMAVAAVERIGIRAIGAATKAKAMGLLQSYANRSGWEPEARRRATEAAARIESDMK